MPYARRAGDCAGDELSHRRRSPAAGLAAAVLLVPALPAEGQTDRVPTAVLEPMVVTGSRIPNPAARNAQSTTVLERNDIDAVRPASAIELLRRVPGLHIDQPGGRGGVSSVYLRGGDPNHTLVLVDGIPVNDPTNSRGGSFDFSTLNVENIERVEVVRGPQSAIYGSNAMAGVINIVTREPASKSEVVLSGGVGTDGYYRGDALARGPLGRARYAFGTGYLDDGEPVEGSRFRTFQTTGKLDWAPADSTLVRLYSRYADSRARSFPDDSGGPRFAVERDRDRRDIGEFTIGGDVDQQLAPWWNLTLKANHYRRREDVSSPGVAPGRRDPFGVPPNNSDSKFERTNLVGSTLFTANDSLRFTLGAAAEIEAGENRSVLFFGPARLPGRFELERTTYATFAEADLTLPGGLVLQPGVRIDFPEDFNAEVSPRLGALYRIDASQTTLRASYGRGFKLPSFFSLGNPIVGNANVKPEKSESVDVGVSQEFWGERGRAGVTFFHTRYIDIIDFEEGPPPRLVNRSEATAKGVELAASLNPAAGLSLSAHASYTRTDIKNSDEELRSRPKWRGGLDADWRPRPDIILHGSVLYVGRVLDSSIPTGDVRWGDYLRVDLAATWAPRPNLAVTLAVDNLFDADYQEAVGFPASGIRPRLSARVSF